MNAAAMHRSGDDGLNLGERVALLGDRVALLGERTAKTEGVVEQIDWKVNWILGITATVFIGMVFVLVKILVAKG